ncbi:hypothetical protein MA16_Dca025031 [Dendrobium catenatum]|uniref:Uncharacterized protein n=1 Tax=Dendrobium catenatum TaxID=906689 RepID=A0A2I0VI80_9ASPA|nr:hypothetical protein MA16_Dca025031 [Dendrobium catenatum]
MCKPFEEAYKLVENMATNNFQWYSNNVNHKRVADIYEYDTLFILTAQVAAISKKFNTIGVSLGS